MGEYWPALYPATRPGWIEGRVKTRLRGKLTQLGWALDGTFTAEQRWLLRQELRQLEWIETQVEVLEQEIERRIAPFEEFVKLLVSIPGIERKTAWMLVAELGVDMSVFGDARHLASWAGVCPGNRESGGKRLSGRTRKSNPYVRRGMCQAAWGTARTKNCYLSAFYKRMQIRKGPQKANKALAHHLIAVVFNVLSRKEAYVELGGDYHDRQNRRKVVGRLVARLGRLGYGVELTPLEPAMEPLAQRGTEPAALEVVKDPSAFEPATAKDKVLIRRKRGRPCKCAGRGIACKRGRSSGGDSVPALLMPAAVASSDG